MELVRSIAYVMQFKEFHIKWSGMDSFSSKTSPKWKAKVEDIISHLAAFAHLWQGVYNMYVLLFVEMFWLLS